MNMLKEWRLEGDAKIPALLVILLLSSAVILVVNSGVPHGQNYWHARMGISMPVSMMPFVVESSLSPRSWHNLLVPTTSNYTSTLLNSILLNETSSSQCYKETTNVTKLEGLPAADPRHQRYILTTNKIYQLALIAFDTNGKKRCAGGDYFEVDLHDEDSAHYRSRLPTVDFGNGSYGLELLVPSRFAGSFVLEIWLLFSNWHGFDQNTQPWAKTTLMISQELEFVVNQDFHSAEDVPTDLLIKYPFVAKTLPPCTPRDFDRTSWQGRWTRTWRNESCEADDEKRFRCVPEEHSSCEEPWCFGSVAGLESNGWHYSAHCGFKIFEPEEAWECLNGKWFFMWGDSNHQDTIRNLLSFVLKYLPEGARTMNDFRLPRSYETVFINPHRYDQTFKVSAIFNGANFVRDNLEGLHTLMHEEHQQQLVAHFNGTTWPDTIIMNSGLHDGHDSVDYYSELADFVVQWWINFYDSFRGRKPPRLIWRTTITPAGTARGKPGNPNRLEMFNLAMVEKLHRVRDKLPVKFVDAFDLTFPFHYDHNYSDGGHYGRVPGANNHPWRNGEAHWYFVDIMLCHILLNAVCS